MTSEQIKRQHTDNATDELLREIAYQLAVLNEREDNSDDMSEFGQRMLDMNSRRVAGSIG